MPGVAWVGVLPEMQVPGEVHGNGHGERKDDHPPGPEVLVVGVGAGPPKLHRPPLNGDAPGRADDRDLIGEELQDAVDTAPAVKYPVDGTLPVDELRQVEGPLVSVGFPEPLALVAPDGSVQQPGQDPLCLESGGVPGEDRGEPRDVAHPDLHPPLVRVNLEDGVSNVVRLRERVASNGCEGCDSVLGVVDPAGVRREAAPGEGRVDGIDVGVPYRLCGREGLPDGLPNRGPPAGRQGCGLGAVEAGVLEGSGGGPDRKQWGLPTCGGGWAGCCVAPRRAGFMFLQAGPHGGGAKPVVSSAKTLAGAGDVAAGFRHPPRGGRGGSNVLEWADDATNPVQGAQKA